MKSVDNLDFSLIIGFLLPGFIALKGASYFSDMVNIWLSNYGAISQDIGNIVLVILASLCLGIIISGLRYIIIDRLMLKNINNKCLDLDFKKFSGKREDFLFIVENHYRYHLFYGNTLIALIGAYVSRGIYFLAYKKYCWQTQSSLIKELFILILFLILTLVLFLSSKDTFGKYADRATQILNVGGMTMTNGIGKKGSDERRPQQPTKPTKPTTPTPKLPPKKN